MGAKWGRGPRAYLEPCPPGPHKDSSQPYAALAVADIQDAKAELDRMGVEHVTLGAVRPEQIFMHDPFGNMMVTEPSGAR